MRYGQWNGNPKGFSENKENCIEEVWPAKSNCFISHQCTRKRGFGPEGKYCSQHAKSTKNIAPIKPKQYI